MVVPPPGSWDEFEDVTLSCLKIKWSSPNLTRHGRQGQPQAGVDIYGDDDLGRFVGVQCKLTQQTITTTIVKDEVAKADKFEPRLDAFFVATTAPTDVVLQKAIRLLSKERVSQDRFPVGIFFWGDLFQELVKNELEFKKHYPQISLTSQPDTRLGARLLSLIDIAYFGLNLRFYMGLIFGEVGLMSGEDPHQFQAVANIVEGCATVLLDSTKLDQLTEMIEELARYSLSCALGEEDKLEGWTPANNLAVSIEQLISRLEYGLTGKELAAFTAGRLIGAWDKTDVLNTRLKTLTPELEKHILASITALSTDGALPDEILQEIKRYQKSDDPSSIYNTPNKVYNFVRRMVLYQEMGITQPKRAAYR